MGRLMAISQAALLCGCAAYLPVSSGQINEAERLERRIKEHPDVLEILYRHGSMWLLDITGTPGPVFNYGKYGDQFAGKDPQGRDVIAPILDEYSTADLDHLAEVVAAEVKAMHFSRPVEFMDVVHHRRTYVITPAGEVKRAE